MPFFGALIDPFVMVPALIAGYVLPRWWGRALLAIGLGWVVTIVIVTNLDVAGVILPSDKPQFMFSGLIARATVAWTAAEIMAWIRRRKLARPSNVDVSSPFEQRPAAGPLHASHPRSTWPPEFRERVDASRRQIRSMSALRFRLVLALTAVAGWLDRMVLHLNRS
jgi:hypothetical protein